MNRWTRSGWKLGVVAALSLFVLLLVSASCCLAASDPVAPQTQVAAKDPQTVKPDAESHWKILHIMSYHSPWEWTDDQLRGFKEAFKGLDVEYKVFQMDTKRNSSEEMKEEGGT